MTNLNNQVRAFTNWDRRQLVAARGRLKLAARNVELALERADNGNNESVLRALGALSMAEDAVRDLGRFVRRKDRPPVVTNPSREAEA